MTGTEPFLAHRERAAVVLFRLFVLPAKAQRQREIREARLSIAVAIAEGFPRLGERAPRGALRLFQFAARELGHDPIGQQLPFRFAGLRAGEDCAQHQGAQNAADAPPRRPTPCAGHDRRY
ncbi:hypothetical protein D3C83_06000 [compost metagenome]